MYWVGKPGDSVRRGSAVIDLSEQRWIVPTNPYNPPRGSFERIENAILLGVGVAAIAFSFIFLVLASL